MNIEEYLFKVEIFQKITPEDVRRIADVSKVVSYPDGQYITRQGEQPDNLWVVCKGKVEVIVEKGKEKRHVAFLGPGEIFGEMTVFQRDFATADVVSRGGCNVIEIPGEFFKDVIYESPVSIGMMAQKMTKRFSELMKKK
ncbi:MAG: cyclic nucleotide-binding domain-containing protein [Proteobacteria bacterium]|nr:cyclic nucleotide-binding domain-containing protein [Pseudomonadota bacterium]MBU1711298.1 cyclic nucleotide-binding domain-containing protein [Pseudomonadota bacterium]